MFHTMMQSMFHMELPIAEKILRPVIVFLVLVGFLRLFGKRELAQLNPFDLVVLLSLSNTVQNAIIGNDNSVTGGVVGALALLSINWIVSRLLYKMPKLNAALEGPSTTLIENGKLNHKALKAEALTEEELLSVLHKQSYDRVEDVRKCVLEPNGTFYIEGNSPNAEEQDVTELMNAVKKLTIDLQELRAELRERDNKLT